MEEESVRGVASFLVDAARAEVSMRTVVQVLRHWQDEGATTEELLGAVEVARKACAATHAEELDRLEAAIRGGLPLSPGSHDES